MRRQERTRSNHPAHQSATAHGARPAPATAAPSSPLLRLQHRIGNRATGRLLQARLKVSQPGDAFEQEADEVADHVLRMPDLMSSGASEGSSPFIQSHSAPAINGRAATPAAQVHSAAGNRAQASAGNAATPAAPMLMRQPAAPAQAPPCSQDQITDIGDIGKEVVFLVLEPALTKLDTYISSDPNQKPDKETRQVALMLFRNFDAYGPAGRKIAPQVRSTLSIVKSKSQNWLNLFDLACPPLQTYGQCPQATAYITDQSKLTFCPSFFKSTQPWRFHTFIHEMAHASGTNIIDRGYTHQRIYSRLTTAEALLNAESYSRFAMELHDEDVPAEERQFQRFNFPDDKYPGCSGAQSGIISEALAWAEIWNYSAFNAFSDADALLGFADILAGFGVAQATPPPAHLNNALVVEYQNAYKAARNFFQQDLTFKCDDRDSDACEKAGLLIKDGVSFKVCSKWLKPGQQAGWANSILQSVYKGLLGFPKWVAASSIAYQIHQRGAALPKQASVPAPAPTQAAVGPSPQSSVSGGGSAGNGTTPAATAATTKKRDEVAVGRKGCPVPELQEKLNIANKSSIPVSGVFDNKTRQEVINFQNANALLTTPGVKKGVADAKTWETLHTNVPGNHGVPTGETFTAMGWSSGNDATMLKWKQQLQPTTTDFSGCVVEEEDPVGYPRANTCCKPGELDCMKKITGGRWTVGKNNEFSIDTVGLITFQVDKYRMRNRVPCNYAIPQRMVLVRPEGNVEYIQNLLIYYISSTEVFCMKTSPIDMKFDKKKYP
ncbi:MAG TPA: peptidoglycan-binding protein [Blastocatellia bacterium]|nr:peptidoglycan-binding protein [Blastocatellia bacterium]